MENRIKYIKEKVSKLPLLPGVYKMLDMYGNIIYIGKAKALKNRVSSYFINTTKPEKVTQMVANVYDFDYIVCPSELEALQLESNLIHRHMPFYNILLKDGKAFPYLKIDIKSDFPRVEITRKVKKDGCVYFGPYFGGISITELYNIINNTFKLKDCNIKTTQKRACLNYHIGNCLAPCINKVTKDEYREEVKKVINFLKGDLSEAKKILTDKMMRCSQNLLFEKALEYKNNLAVIEKIDNKLITQLTTTDNIDVFGYATNGQNSVITLLIVRGGKLVGVHNYNIIDASLEMGDIVTNFITQYYMQNPAIPDNVVVGFESDTLSEWLSREKGKKVAVTFAKKGIKKKLLDMATNNGQIDLEKSIEKEKLYTLKTTGAIKRLQEKLGLSRLPRRIEGFDISNISGTNTVASMVVFTNGVPNKSHYRKFRLARNTPNDFESMKEVVTRRIGELKGTDPSFSCTPDLILIDGGKGQLGYAYKVLQENGLYCDIISLAEREEEIYLPNESDPIILSRNDYALKLLQNVRDESHRFAITFHRSVRQKNTLTSKLKSIDGVGEKTIKALYSVLKSFDNIKNADLKTLQDIKGVNKTQAKNIYDYFHNNQK